MNIVDFNKIYDAEFLCEALFSNASDKTVTGIVLAAPVKGVNGRYTVHIDSVSLRIPLNRILKLTKSSRKWDDL